MDALRFQSIGFQTTIPEQAPTTGLPVKGNSYYQIMLIYVNSFFNLGCNLAKLCKTNGIGGPNETRGGE